MNSKIAETTGDNQGMRGIGKPMANPMFEALYFRLVVAKGKEIAAKYALGITIYELTEAIIALSEVNQCS